MFEIVLTGQNGTFFAGHSGTRCWTLLHYNRGTVELRLQCYYWLPMRGLRRSLISQVDVRRRISTHVKTLKRTQN
jgi:hypothetical protein